MLFPEKTKGYHLLLYATSYGQCAKQFAFGQHVHIMQRLGVQRMCPAVDKNPQTGKNKIISSVSQGPTPVRDPELIKRVCV